MQSMTEVVVKYWDIVDICEAVVDLSYNASQNNLERCLAKFGLKYKNIEGAQDVVCTLCDSKMFLFYALKSKFEYVLRESNKD